MGIPVLPGPLKWVGESGSVVGGIEVESLGMCLGCCVGDSVRWILALACRCPRPPSPGLWPQAFPSPLGSEAAGAGLCAGQCILKVNGSNVMNDGAPEVLEHFQAFRNRREEALVSFPAAKRIGETLLIGVEC